MGVVRSDDLRTQHPLGGSVRDLHTDIETSLEGEAHRECWLVEFAFSGGSIFSTTADFTITHGGDAYLNDGLIVALPELAEDADGTRQVAFQLNPTAAIMAKVGTSFRFDLAYVYFARFDSDYEVIDEPVLIGQFAMSHFEVENGKPKLVCYSEGIEGRGRSGVMTNGHDQKARYSGDTAHDYTDKIVNMELSWGGVTAGYSGGFGNDGGAWDISWGRGQGGFGDPSKPPGVRVTDDAR